MMEDIRLLYIDLFCGAGGTSTGVENASVDGKKCGKVIACVNHDANAIASHAANHPDALHFTEDIRTLELSPMAAHVSMYRMLYPRAKLVLWASLECTNFSKAKGGQPRDADSRTLAEHLFRYIEAIDPDYIQIENVEEFMSWGNVDENGRPISRYKGVSYLRWVRNVRRYGYNYDYRLLNAADFGAYTSRLRYFAIFSKVGLPAVFPEPTHSRSADMLPSSESVLFPNPVLKPWKPVRDVLDLDDEGSSIFTRKKPLVEATLNRIYAGLVKFVAGGKDAFMVKYNSMSASKKYVSPSIDAPCPTVAVQHRLGVAKVRFLSKYYGGSPEGKSISVDAPAGSVTTSDHHAFISVHYGNGYNRSIDEPAPTLTTKDRLAFIDLQYGNGRPVGINVPAPTVTNNPKHNVVSCRLMNPRYYSVEKPCFTLTGRMDKMPPYLIQAKTGDLAIVIYETDSPAMVKIKEFMSMYGIVDITMRMLNMTELKRIQGFPEEYVLVGTQADQKKFLGNAVVTVVAQRMCEALWYSLVHGDRVAV